MKLKSIVLIVGAIAMTVWLGACSKSKEKLKAQGPAASGVQTKTAEDLLKDNKLLPECKTADAKILFQSQSFLKYMLAGKNLGSRLHEGTSTENYTELEKVLSEKNAALSAEIKKRC